MVSSAGVLCGFCKTVGLSFGHDSQLMELNGVAVQGDRGV